VQATSRDSPSRLDRLEHDLERATRAIALVAVAALLLLAIATCVDIVGRYAFGTPIRGFTDVAGLATAVAVAAFFPALLARRANITLRVGARFLGPRTARVLDAFGALLTAVFFGLMAWQYARYAAEAAEGGEHMAVLAWPVSPWWWAVTVLIAVTAVAGAVVFVLEAAGSQRRDL
jgi:TRAP-type C4-dicarboxylate transport system permease small subunit